jgi:actin-related protein
LLSQTRLAMAGDAAAGGMPTLVVDNGGGTVKMGWSTDTSPVVVLNAKAKPRGGE